MRYRAYPDNDNNGPMEDIARAVKYITGHAQQIGYSSGGHLAGLFASDALGYKKLWHAQARRSDPGVSHRAVFSEAATYLPCGHRSLCVRPVLLMNTALPT